MVIDLSRVSPRAAAALRESGWTPERRVDAQGIVAALRAGGFDCPPPVREVLASFEGITVTWLRHAGRGSHPDSIAFDALSELRFGPDRAWVQDYEARIGARICPVGSAFSDHATVYVAAEGSIYVAFDGELSLMGRSIGDALSTMIDDTVIGTPVPPLKGSASVG